MTQIVSYFEKIFLSCALMTLNEAFIQFTLSETFKEISKDKGNKGGKYRGYLSRFRAGNLKTGAIVELLITNGYEIKANKVTKKK
ncbi:MAG TPA: hypothetical protein VMU83_07885 [Hanamia sp.]|nr:hypothetical protein [Hanamia sp.]